MKKPFKKPFMYESIKMLPTNTEEDELILRRLDPKFGFNTNKTEIRIIEILIGIFTLVILGMITLMLSCIILGGIYTLGNNIGFILPNYTDIIIIVFVFFSLIYILIKLLNKIY